MKLAAHVKMHTLCPLYAKFPTKRFDLYVPVPQAENPKQPPRRRGCPLVNLGASGGPCAEYVMGNSQASRLTFGDSAELEVRCGACRAATGGRQLWYVQAPIIEWPRWR